MGKKLSTIPSTWNCRYNGRVKDFFKWISPRYLTDFIKIPFLQVELKPGYYLEARPHAYTDDDKPVYTRTGKVAKKVFFFLWKLPS